jgi:hypothetical protein
MLIFFVGLVEGVSGFSHLQIGKLCRLLSLKLCLNTDYNLFRNNFILPISFVDVSTLNSGGIFVQQNQFITKDDLL